MPTPLSPWMTKVYELLGQAPDEWHDRGRLVEAVMPLVPPGKATRQAVADRTRMAAARRRRDAPTVPANSRVQDPQTVGARRKVTQSIEHGLRNGRLQSRTHAGRPQIRLTPKPTTNEGTP